MENNQYGLHNQPRTSQSSEIWLKGIFDAAIDFGILVIDHAGIIVDWNRGAELMFGYKRNEAVGQHTDIIFTPEDRYARISEKEMNNARSTGRSLDERCHLNKNGTRFFMSGVMTRLEEDTLSGFVKIARNITDRKLAEEALLLSEQRKNLAVKSAEMGEWEWDLVADRVLISDQVGLLLGLPAEQREIAPQELVNLVFPEDKENVLDRLNEALKGSNIFETECRIIRNDNQQVRWVNVYGRVVAHSTDQASKMIGVLYDITSRKLLEKQKDDFISLASHELQTPLTAIKSYSEFLLQNLEQAKDEKNASLLRRMNGQVDRLIGLIRNMLDMSILEEGRMNLYLQSLDVNKLIEDQMYNLEWITRNHRLSWHPGSIHLLKADRDRVMQVVTNFVSNAVKYSPAGTEIIISTTDQMDKVLVSVNDHGMGIPPEAQKLVFERFYRVKNAPHEKGFGLGLYICAEIIKAHHGTIGVSSTPGEGSTFYFTLPYS